MKKNKHLQLFARALRNNMTKAEKKIWYEMLCDKQFNGFRFIRQKVIDKYIVDFYCHELKLIVEIDGKSHEFDDSNVTDRVKESHFKRSGYSVIRFSDYEVMRQPELVFEVLA